MLEADPDLLRKTAPGHGSGYFRDPKLFWYIANNPKLVDRMPSNIVELAQLMIERGVERADLDVALGLVMTSASARIDGHQADLVRVLLDAGAAITPETITATAAHRELAILRSLIAGGEPMTVPLAAALGDDDALATMIAHASADEIALAFALAVINQQHACVRIALAAGADVNAYVPAGAHAHATALHQAAANDDAALIELLLAHGARTDQRDAIWDGTPLDWARHEAKPAAQAALEAAARR